NKNKYLYILSMVITTHYQIQFILFGQKTLRYLVIKFQHINLSQKMVKSFIYMDLVIKKMQAMKIKLMNTLNQLAIKVYILDYYMELILKLRMSKTDILNLMWKT